MAGDVATLGFAVDSGPLTAAAAALDKMATASKGAESASDRAAAAARRSQGSNAALEATLKAVQSQMIAMAGGLGLVGVGLAALGPAGLAAAVALKLLGDAISFVLEESRRMGEGATDLRRFADVAGLTIPQVKALKQAGGELGISSEVISSSFLRLTASMTEAGRASGTVFEEVQKLSGGLANQLLLAKNEEERINILAKAYNSATDASIRATLARAAFGRQGMAQGPILDTIAMAGGIQNLVKVTKDWDGATEAQTRQWDKMSRDIAQTEKRAKNIFASIFTSEGLQAALTAAQLMERLAIAAKDAAEQKEGLSGLQRFFLGMAQQSPVMQGADPAVLDKMQAVFAARQRLSKGMGGNLGVDEKELNSWVQLGDNLRGVLTPAEKVAKTLTDTQNAAAAAATLQEKRVGALGAAATIDEQAQLKLLKVESDRLNNIFSLIPAENDLLAARARSAAATDARVQKDALRITQLGELAPLTELNRQKEDQLAKAMRDGAKFSAEEIAQMRIRNQLLNENSKIENQMVFDRQQLFKSQGEQTADAALRAAGIPPESARAAAIRDYMRMTDALKQMQDAAGTFASGFLTDLSHGVKAMDALRNALTRLADSLIDMAAKRLVAQAFGAFFGGGFGGAIGGGFGKAAVAHTGGIVGQLPATRYIHPAYFDNAPRFAGGGLVGGEVPVIAHVGEHISTPAQWAAQGRGGTTIVQHFNISGAITQSDVVSMIQESAMRTTAYTNAVVRQADRTSTSRQGQKRMLEN